MTTPAADAHDALYISKLIQPKLHGLGPEVQGSVLADLVAIFFAGMHPDMREQQFEIWLEMLRGLIEIESEGKW